MRKRTGVEKDCVICGKVFYKPKCHGYIQCCSRKCGYELRGQSNTGRTHFKKGVIPWNKNISGYMGANKTSFKKGDEPWNKGMGMATEDSRLRWSPAYKLWRESIFERDDYTCQYCGDRGGKLNADHIKSYALYPKLRLDINNGRTLCVPCHKQTPTYGRLSKKQISEANLS